MFSCRNARICYPNKNRFDQVYYEKPIKFEELRRLQVTRKPTDRALSPECKEALRWYCWKLAAPDRIYRELFLKNHTQRVFPVGHRGLLSCKQQSLLRDGGRDERNVIAGLFLSFISTT